MISLTITEADNQAAADNRAKHVVEHGHDKMWAWDVCKCCPVAQAFNRERPEHTWLVNRNGARPAGALSYWYRFSTPLRQALDAYDQSKGEKPILGVFRVYTHEH